MKLLQTDRTMTSLELAEAFEQSHDNVLKTLRRIEKNEKISRRTCELREYKDERGKMQPMLVFDMNMAFAFVEDSRSKNKAEKFLQLVELALKENVDKLIAESAQKAIAENNRKRIANPRAHLSKQKGDLQEEWHELSWLDLRLGSKFLEKTKSGMIRLKREN